MCKVRLHWVSVCLSDSHRNDKATDCKHTLTFQGLTNNWDIMFTERQKVRKNSWERGTFKDNKGMWVHGWDSKWKSGTRKMWACESVAAENNLCVIAIHYEGQKQTQNKDQVCVCQICVWLNLNRGVLNDSGLQGQSNMPPVCKWSLAH